ncbi:MAG TPA: hypothetical protein VF041_15235 [Gemmatimonadaceae bacterium]
MRSDVNTPFMRLMVAGAALALHGAPARAQMHFPPPGGSARYERYVIPEQCLAAARRVVDSVGWGARPDTMPYDTRDTLPAAVAETAHRCGARFDAAHVERQSLPALRDLALMAGDDSVARAVTERQIANARGAPLAERAAVLVQAVHAYVTARPLRLDAVREYLRRLDALGPDASTERVAAHAEFSNAYVVGMLDVGMFLEEMKAIGDIVEHVPPKIRAADPQYWQTQELVIHVGAAEASALRDGPTVALAEMSQRGWTEGTMLGRRAPAIVARHWFARADGAPRPRAGRVSMIVSVDPTCGVQCFSHYATLRRIARRYPELDITLVAYTHGFFGLHPPPPPAEEAALDSAYFLGAFRLPGALAVDVTPFTTVPEPDGRRINGVAPNQTNYLQVMRTGDHTEAQMSGLSLDFFLVSPGGVIQFQGSVWPSQERLIDAEIDAMYREASGRAAAK